MQVSKYAGNTISNSVWSKTKPTADVSRLTVVQWFSGETYFLYFSSLWRKNIQPTKTYLATPLKIQKLGK